MLHDSVHIKLKNKQNPRWRTETLLTFREKIKTGREYRGTGVLVIYMAL